MQQEIVFDNEPRAQFAFGQINATPNALEKIPNDEIMLALSRHLRGDWGEMEPEDLKANEDAFLHGGRLFSRYRSLRNVRFWIITEADGSYTTILLPQDY